VCPVEDSTGRHRTARRTRRAFEPAVTQAPAVLVSAAGTGEALGPPQPR
jgi:hypothetical protein